MIGEELKNHCNISSSLGAAPASDLLTSPFGEIARSHGEASHVDFPDTPQQNVTDYSRLARMYASSPNLLLPSRQTIHVEDIPQEPVCF